MLDTDKADIRDIYSLAPPQRRIVIESIYNDKDLLGFRL